MKKMGKLNGEGEVYFSPWLSGATKMAVSNVSVSPTPLKESLV